MFCDLCLPMACAMSPLGPIELQIRAQCTRVRKMSQWNVCIKFCVCFTNNVIVKMQKGLNFVMFWCKIAMARTCCFSSLYHHDAGMCVCVFCSWDAVSKSRRFIRLDSSEIHCVRRHFIIGLGVKKCSAANAFCCQSSALCTHARHNILFVSEIETVY